MKISLVNRLYVGFALVVLLVLLGGFLTWRTFERQRAESVWVQRTYKGLNQLERVNRLLLDMEASRRGYRATFEKKFLQAYEINLPKMAPALLTLRAVLADDLGENRNMDTLENNINAILSFWNELDHHIYKQTFEENTEITTKEAGLMDQIRNTFVVIRSEENRMLMQRETENERSVNNAFFGLLWNNGFILLVGFVLIAVTYREFKRRLKIQEYLNANLDEVVELNNQANQRNWKLVGMDQLNSSLQGILNVQTLGEKSLTELVSYGRFVAGAFYVYYESQQKLRLTAKVGMPANVPDILAPGEGILGQTLKSKTIRVITDLPPDFWKVTAASGTASPRQLVLIPLWLDSEIIGVIELAAFHEVSPVQVELLETQSKDIAVALNAAYSREKVMELLQQVQEQREVLLNQQEELRQSNEELSRQSEVLQTSEEELRVQEEELRQVNAEMTVKNHALEAARQALAAKAAELEASSRYKSDFLANMSHELRTPLNSVLILAKILEEDRDKNLTPRQIEYAGIIHKSGTDLLTLINDILDLSKIEAGKIDLHLEEEQVENIQQDIEDLFVIVAQQKNIRFIRKIAPDVPSYITTDKQRLEQVLRNLLSNAFKFTPEKGTITIAWYMADGKVHVSVTDTGMGIPEDKQQLIFEAFQQADGSTSRKFGGTGLGLSISRELMQLLQGEIRLDSSSPAGSTFTIVFPVEINISTPQKTVRQPVPEAVIPVSVTQDDRDNINASDKLILIVEDDPWFASMLSDVAHSKSFKTIIAHNGQEGLTMARQYKPVAIVLDMNLPVIDGESILKILRSSDDLKDILVHVVSANEISSNTADNVNGYTQKPLQPVDLDNLFLDIGTQLNARLKQVLLVAYGSFRDDSDIRNKSTARKLPTQYDQVTGISEAINFLEEKKYDAVIFELGAEIPESLGDLQRLYEKTHVTDTPIIAYLDKDISTTEEGQLKKYTTAIVRSSALATDRLLDELELFFYKLQKIDPKKLETVQIIRDTENIISGKTILLADDDMRNVFSISALLEEQGANVLTAADGEEALALLEQHPLTDLVLMDIMMPGMNGYEAMKKIRTDKRFTQLPIIALTAKAMAEDRQHSIDAGASDYITKPVDGNKLLSLIRVWLS
ncbi:response regulator [Chitinophaga sp. Cy-1792]|uniref:response regulator n=1 Tax=Chitinophaga sp. Cy-1792 TaxID=2608339 RepID=UPI0014221992|nr:response regulator [Chitinophaga sp. Cy-1792]NIG54220.1 response regulator [Chitinophaga sp. Cy-1792]